MRVPSQKTEMPRKPSEGALEKARRLSKEDVERLLSRTRKNLKHRLNDQELSPLEVVAMQLQIEDEELNEWRARWAEIREKIKSN